MYSAKEIVDMIKAVLITILLIVIFYGIIRAGCKKIAPTEMTVIDCYPVENYYEVIVEDNHGNQWSYFSDHYTEDGIISVLMNDADEIIKVK